MTKKIITSVAGATILLSIIGVLSKGIGFIREIVYANSFGLTAEFDLYLASSALPLVINISLIYICQHYFVPAYYKSKNESQKNADLFFNSAFWWFLIGGMILAFLIFLFSGSIINFYMSSLPAGVREEGLVIFRIFLVTLPLNAGMAIIGAYLQSEFDFLTPAIANTIVNLVVILLVIFFTRLLHVIILPISFIAAYLLAFMFLLFKVRKKIVLPRFTSFNFNYQGSEVKIIIALIFIEFFSLSLVLLDRYFLGVIPQGGIAALNYAITIFALPVSVFTLSLLSPIFSRFTESSFNFDGRLMNDLKTAIGMNAFVIVPISFILFFWGDSLISIFYQRGKFSGNDSLLTHTALQYYVISLVFYSAYLIIVKLFYSLNDYRTILIISILAVVLKIIFNVVTVDSMYQNGLALSTSLIYFFLFFAGFYLGLRKMKSDEKFIHINFILYFIINAVTSYLIIIVLSGFFSNNGAVGFIFESGLFIFIYTVNSFMLKDSEPVLIKNTILRFSGNN